MNRRLCFMIFVLALGATISEGRQLNQSTDRITTRVSQVRHERELVVELTNTSKETININEDRLPWKWRYAMIIKTFKADATGTPIEEAFGISDPLPGSVVLKPGQRLSGKIDLDVRFPDLENALRENDVLLLWSYVPIVNATSGARSAGVLILPRTP